MKNFIQPGKTIEVTLAATKASGDVLLIGSMVGVLANGGVSGDVVIADTCGVFEVPKLSTDVVTQGAPLYWDNTNSRMTVTASGNTFAGWAWKAAGNGVTKVWVNLDRSV